jgi:transcriptional regulator with XRE-family HTH domain
MPHNTLGKYVYDRRRALKLSQEQLADQIGGNFGQSDVSRIERGLVQQPRMTTMVRLATALEVSVGDLLIASGWFDSAPVAVAPAPDPAPAGSFMQGMLTEINAELEAIGDLERRAASRSQELRRLIQGLKAPANGSHISLAAD